MAVPICKIAFKTILRYGWAAIIFLTLGLYFLFPACKSWEEIQAERKQPYELQATVMGTAQLEKYIEVENIKAVSPVISFNTKLTDVNFTLSSQVKAVSADYLKLDLKEGCLYQDQSNMPFLILNRYASEHFVDENKKESIVQVNDSVTINLNGTEEKAIICGIFEDDLESPVIYMSYYEAAKYFPKEEIVNLLFLLTGKGAAEQAVKDLGHLKVNVSLDENAIVRWELLQQQAVQYFITALGFLSCSMVLMRNQLKCEISDQRAERQRLLMSGLTMGQLGWILKLRLLFSYGICLCAAVFVAWLFDLLSITAAIAEAVLLLLHYLVTQMAE